MKYKKVKAGYVLKLEKGEPVNATLSDFIAAQTLSSHTIQAIGSISNPILAYYNLETKNFIEKEFIGNFELLTCTGSIAFEGNIPLIHIHTVISREDFSTIGGHVKEMTAHATVELFLFDLEDKLEKSYNNEIGLKLFNLECDFNS